VGKININHNDSVDISCMACHLMAFVFETISSISIIARESVTIDDDV